MYASYHRERVTIYMVSNVCSTSPHDAWQHCNHDTSRYGCDTEICEPTSGGLAVLCAVQQRKQGLYFCVEHPKSATIWQHANVQKLKSTMGWELWNDISTHMGFMYHMHGFALTW